MRLETKVTFVIKIYLAKLKLDYFNWMLVYNGPSRISSIGTR